MTDRAAASGDPAARVSWPGLANLLVVYLVWGSTYLAIRVAVRDGSGFPPFAMSGLRVLVAGGLLLASQALLRQRLRLTRQEAAVLAVSGLLLWVGGNGLVAWAEQRAHSGYAALLVSTTPIWVATMEAVLDRRLPGPLLVVSLLVGLAGVAVLTGPVGGGEATADPSSVAAILLAAFLWGMGSLLQTRRPVAAPPMVSAAYQMLVGSVGFAVLATLTREPLPQPVLDAWLAWAYLVVFGSLLAFTSFVRCLRLLPTSITMTYGFVNPAIAVLLGWMLLGEPITPEMLVGMALVLAGVAGVFRARYGARRAG